jgi:hypothetical protein
MLLQNGLDAKFVYQMSDSLSLPRPTPQHPLPSAHANSSQTGSLHAVNSSLMFSTRPGQTSPRLTCPKNLPHYIRPTRPALLLLGFEQHLVGEEARVLPSYMMTRLLSGSSNRNIDWCGYVDGFFNNAGRTTDSLSSLVRSRN